MPSLSTVRRRDCQLGKSASNASLVDDERPRTATETPDNLGLEPLEEVSLSVHPALTATDRFIRSRTESNLESSDTPIFQAVMDRIEDEVEAHTYEDVVPLDIKLALEDKVFGWSHLSSSILGHVAYTLGAYWVVYEFCTILFVRILPKHYDSYGFQLNTIRTILSLWAALCAYRVVRRRRRVWFRNAYGSSAYKNDEERRRQMVAETDRTTALGRLVQNFRHKRLLRKLKRAENQFTKKHQKQNELLRQFSSNELQGDSSVSSISSNEEQRLLTGHQSECSYNSTGSSSDEEEDCVSPLVNVRNAPLSPKTLTTDALTFQQTRKHFPSFHTKPTHRMHSIGHDEYLMEEAIKIMPYSHGGFFGAAPFLLSNAHWISILRYLMPDVYVEISRRVAGSAPSRLIHWAENNPVVAAYGIAHSLEQQNFEKRSCNSTEDPDSLKTAAQNLPNIEWDVFLDPALVRRVQVVLDRQEDLKLQIAKNKYTKEEGAQIDTYYNHELKKRSQMLVDKMLIAHGNTIQIIMEQLDLPFMKGFNYSRVKRTRRTLGGGIYARQWMAVFAEALRLGMSDANQADIASPRDSPSITAPLQKKRVATLLALAESSCPDTTMSESIAIIESICNCKNPIGLVLDVKSRHVAPKIWAVVVNTLRQAGVRVEGIASFFVEEIRDLSRFSSREPIREIVFCHSAGDLQAACLRGDIQRGDQVFFNGGCLIRCLLQNETSSFQALFGSFNSSAVKKSYEIAAYALPRKGRKHEGEGIKATLQDYKLTFDLSIGLYCQEFAIDEAALQLLIRLVNNNMTLYSLGLSWGGVNGITIQGISPGRFTKTDGYWNQRYVGVDWDDTLLPAHVAHKVGKMNPR